MTLKRDGSPSPVLGGITVSGAAVVFPAVAAGTAGVAVRPNQGIGRFDH
ncbi:hypothetical protein [Sphingomonas corticis]|jgi:hypothetical protein|uniref:Uncharacterized protein n=1 Tax=Sphingomonas corticis TaxID=2722791 RepID=A0ABX1CVP2_9SPHN|nr:hypothetical protein [Sphingomonas corticis]NJR79967.1 hypothetical protein [Sphingomonas corticis]